MAIRCAVMGMGYWGPIIGRNVLSSSQFELVALCDLDIGRLRHWQGRLRIVRGSTNPLELIRAPDIDAVFIAVPLQHHFDLAMESLKAGKHVCVEKPLVASSDQAAALVETAFARDRILMVDHVFVYTPAVRCIRELVATQSLGKVYYYDSVRINLGLLRNDSNVLWDLAVHDLSIVDYVFDEKPTAVTAVGGRHLGTPQETMAYMSCFFDSGFMVHIHVNWLAPVKVRKVFIGGSDRMIAYDDIEADEKIKIYDRGVDVAANIDNQHSLQIGYRVGDVRAPNLDRYEAVQEMVSHFADCIDQHRQPITDGVAGLRTVKLLEAADRALRNNRSRIAVAL